MGIEDYQSNDPNRPVSAVRNFYAGVLLLAKAALVNAVPDADLNDVLAASYKPVPDGVGGVEYVAESKVTIDFNNIHKRFKDFGLNISRPALDELNRIRNELEHKYSDRPKEALRAAISAAFPVVIELFHHLDKSPGAYLGAAWEAMLQTHELFEAEKMTAATSFKKISWYSSTISEKGMLCPECAFPLLKQIDSENETQEDIELECRYCNSEPKIDAAIVYSLESHLEIDSYVRVKDGGEDGPIFFCVECNNEAYVDFEECCAVCGYGYGDQTCDSCGSSISLSDLSEGLDNGLCGYCNYRWEKVRNE